MNSQTKYCQYPYYSTYDCYRGQIDELRIYQRQLTASETQEISTKQNTGIHHGTLQRRVAAELSPVYIPWLGPKNQVVLQHKIPNIMGRYVFIKFPACDADLAKCNSQHAISILRAHVDRQKWSFNRSHTDQGLSAWSWTGDLLPDLAHQQPWSTSKGLCFRHDTMLLSHRKFLGMADFSVEMDLKKITAVTGLVFTYVPDSPLFGKVRVHYDISPDFSGERSQTMDLSSMGTFFTSANNMQQRVQKLVLYFTGGLVRGRYFKIVLLEYPSAPPCVRVVPIVCVYACEGCCELQQAVDPQIIPSMLAASQNQAHNITTVANVWHTGDKMCRCADAQYNVTTSGFVFERVFSPIAAGMSSGVLRSLRKFECRGDENAGQVAYDGRYSKHKLGRSTLYESGHKALLADGIIDFDAPEPIVLQQGVATIIDWSDSVYARNPVTVYFTPRSVENPV